MIGRLLKKVAKWAAKTLKREAKKSLRDKVIDGPFEDIGLPPSRNRKRGKK